MSPKPRGSGRAGGRVRVRVYDEAQERLKFPSLTFERKPKSVDNYIDACERARACALVVVRPRKEKEKDKTLYAERSGRNEKAACTEKEMHTSTGFLHTARP
jgi:hypothetical protein